MRGRRALLYISFRNRPMFTEPTTVQGKEGNMARHELAFKGSHPEVTFPLIFHCKASHKVQISCQEGWVGAILPCTYNRKNWNIYEQPNQNTIRIHTRAHTLNHYAFLREISRQTCPPPSIQSMTHSFIQQVLDQGGRGAQGRSTQSWKILRMKRW